MFARNNERIDFAELELRVALEETRLSRSELSSRVMTQPEFMSPASTGDIAMVDKPTSHRSLWGRISLLIWSLLHFRSLVRQLITTVYVAEEVRERIGKTEGELAAVINRLSGLAQELDARANSHQSQTESLTNRTESLTNRTDTLIARMDVLTTQTERLATTERDHAGQLATLGGEAERFAATWRDHAGQLATLRGEIMFQQRRLTQLSIIPPTGQPAKTPAETIVDRRFNSLYAAFEDVFRGSREDIKERLSTYLDRLLVAGAGQLEKPIVDIGCGRGEWLELLKENGLYAYGIDINLMMVERSVSLGLDARHADLATHLRGIEDASRSALTAFHVVEHLPFSELVDLLDEAFRVLIPGGMLILETPNPETMRVGATTFYNDPTHRNPLMPEPLRFIVGHRGFTDVKLLKLHPFTEGLLQEKTTDASLLNSVLFGPQDYAIIARRV